MFNVNCAEQLSICYYICREKNSQLVDSLVTIFLWLFCSGFILALTSCYDLQNHLFTIILSILLIGIPFLLGITYFILKQYERVSGKQLEFLARFWVIFRGTSTVVDGGPDNLTSDGGKEVGIVCYNSDLDMHSIDRLELAEITQKNPVSLAETVV